jgi:hypothetical protein
MWQWLIPMAIGAAGKMFNKQPKYGFSGSQIDNMIQAYRDKGIAGINSMGQNERRDTMARMGSMGLADSPITMESAFGPIFEQMSKARSDLESNLAQTKGQLKMGAANQQYQGDMQKWGDTNDLFGSLMDIGGMKMLGGSGGGGGFNFEEESNLNEDDWTKLFSEAWGK